MMYIADCVLCTNKKIGFFVSLIFDAKFNEYLYEDFIFKINVSVFYIIFFTIIAKSIFTEIYQMIRKILEINSFAVYHKTFFSFKKHWLYEQLKTDQ